MAGIVRRREFLAGSAALAGAAIGGFTCVEVASAAAIEVPVIEKLSIRVLVDSTLFSCARRPSTASACSQPRSRAAFPT
jgi:7,8-dihydropterin-6-yl-methyl-4-(beta-D-ribofuranosyl)aminobenzene 5'-phosphate synthase